MTMQRLAETFRQREVWFTVRQQLDRSVGRRVRREANRLWGRPTVHELGQAPDAEVTDNVQEFASWWAGESVDRYRAEFDELCAILNDRRDGDGYPPFYDVGQATAFAIYAHVRARRPTHVLETGVANGASTFFILHALRQNGVGHLHSIDISRDVGQVLTAEERDGWDLRVLDRSPADGHLRNSILTLPALDLFIHDSDHSYDWMRREFLLAWERLAPGGWIASDDAQYSYAYMEFCQKRGLAPHYLLDGIKVFGVAQV
jgi:predicted O-methyltransferase YrrM